MLPKWHILLGAIFALLIKAMVGMGWQNALIIFLASVLIDVDHYVFYVLRKKDWSIKNTYRWWYDLPKNHKPVAQIFHTIEFSTPLIILSLFYNFFIFIFIGIFFHSLVDIVDMFINNKLDSREFSLIRYFILKRRHKNKYL